MTAGIVRFEKDKDQLKDWPYWYNEILFVTKGNGKVTISQMPFNQPESHETGVGDFIYIPKGARVSFEATTAAPFELIYVAAPNPTDTAR